MLVNVLFLHRDELIQLVLVVVDLFKELFNLMGVLEGVHLVLDGVLKLSETQVVDKPGL